MTHAGQLKLSRDIDKAVEKGRANARSQAKKAGLKKAMYYAKIKSKNTSA